MRTGGCQCGRVRYWLSQERLSLYVCHCTECRKQSASAFGLSVPVWRESLSIDGRLDVFERPAASGALMRCFFCPACGTRLYHQSSATDDQATLKGGSLDDLSDLAPIAHIWTRSRLAWSDLPADIPTWDTQPENMATWRAALLPPLQV